MDFLATLRELRQQRERDLEEHAIPCPTTKERWKALLTLELPFKTDVVSLNASWMPGKRKNQQQDATCCITDQTEHQTENDVTYSEDTGLTGSKEAVITEGSPSEEASESESLDEVKPIPYSEDWFSDYKNHDDKAQKISVKRFLSAAGVLPIKCQLDGEFVNVPEEDLSRLSVRRAIKRAITETSLLDSTKKTYISYLNQIYKFFYVTNKNNCIPQPLHQIRLESLAEFFESFENKCLNSNSNILYRDFIEVKIIFYTSLSCTDLQSLSFDPQSNCLHTEFGSYRIPHSFSQLMQTMLTPGEQLFRRNEKQLYKCVKRIAEKCSLGELITPTYLRNGIRAICLQEQIIPERLPHR